MIILRRFLRDRGRSFVGWAIGAGFLVLMTVAFYPTIRDQPTIEEVARDLPEALKATFGIDDDVSLASPEGYLQGRMFSLAMPLALVIFSISAGARAIGGSEEDGDLELVVVQPVSRTRIVLERYAGVALLVVGLSAVFSVGLFVASPPFGAMAGVDAIRVLAACAGATALALLHGTVAFAFGAVFGKRSTAVAAGTVLAVWGYFLQGLLAAARASDGARFASPWHWYLRTNMLVDGPDPLAFVLPLTATAALVVLAVYVFARRDLR